jgi:predicted oxidoreductase
LNEDIFNAMDMVMGNEHTSRPVMILDLNADTPLNLSPSLPDVATHTTIATLSPTPGPHAELQVPTRVPSSSASTSDIEDNPFTTGRKLKKARKRAQDESNENAMELFKDQFNDLKVAREEQNRQTDELLSCIKTLVNHIVTKKD